ncbi:hypothetical protein [Nocardia cyriacigeorgica]|uniref:hypothetical protein n=1 Tax=Nocardia cyriacigeorgica TaxID=135487 RepID=UPI000683F4D1|nr:hypothetical protein [Nocardia cyriacigeorgica]AVH24078.1 hypothetical protein C5B73_24320 [Nocardia cyriacigeorgica]PPJ08932.1 hypothetical protein C5E43_15365 [Nocardia cyriacigeorgica]
MVAILTAAAVLAVGCTADPAPPHEAAAPSSPPANPWLAESEYPITHFNSAATDASTVTGPEVSKELSHSDVQYVATTYSSNPTVKYIGDDRIVLAPSMYGIHKIRATGDRFEEIDFLPYPGMQPPDPALVDSLIDATDAAIAANDDAALVGLAGQAEAAGISYAKIPNGAYSMIDKDGYHYSVIEGGRVLRTTDDNLVDGPLRYDKVVDLRTAPLPEGTPPDVAAAVRQPGAQLVGMGMTFDGHVVVGSSSALVAMNRDLDIVSVLPFSNERLENSFAIDETGIYAVTSRRMLEVAWTGEKLSIAEEDGGWEADYTRSDPAIAQAAGSLTRSGGSGTTPTLMGFGDDEDKLVLISDASADGPSLVAFWRDEIPADADDSGTDAPPSRIAGEVKVDGTDVTLELSPTVFGQDVLATTTAYPEPAPSVWANIFAPGATRAAPRGMQKFHWNSADNTFEKVWENTEVDNSDITVPSVSADGKMLYAASKRDGKYEYVGIDWNTGEIVARWPMPDASRKWNLFGGMITPIGGGDFLAGGLFSIKRVSAGS